MQLHLLIIFILEHLRHEVLSNYTFSESSGVAEQDGGTLVAQQPSVWFVHVVLIRH